MRHYQSTERPFETLPTQDERYTHLWVGIVRRYDQDNEICDVEWLTYSGVRPGTKVSWGHGGPRSYLGGPPEEGALVVCHWLPHLAWGNYQPVIVGYLPTGYKAGRAFNLIREARDEVAPDEEKSRGKRYTMPKLYSGDLAMVSAAGSHVIADENLYLGSASLTETFHRSADMAILTTALQHYTEGADSRVRWGMVERDSEFISGVDPEQDPLGEDDRPLHYVTSGQDAARLEDGADAWVEHRLELRETSDGGLPIPETRYGKHADAGDQWYLRSVHGTLVGNDPGQSSLYGKPLVRLVVSGGSISRSYQSAGGQETTAASAVHLSIGGTESSPTASVDLDKSGRLALSLGSTSGGHPAGNGKSLQIAADGSLDGYFGADSGGTAINLSGSGHLDMEIDGDVQILNTGDMLLQADRTATLTGSTVYLGAGAAAGSGRPF